MCAEEKWCARKRDKGALGKFNVVLNIINGVLHGINGALRGINHVRHSLSFCATVGKHLHVPDGMRWPCMLGDWV